MAAMTACALIGWGCSEPTQRLNAPPQGHSDQPHQLQETFVPMTDNTALADMSMSAVHFVPHQAELNGTGVRRLDRYVSIMKIYGGTLNYDGVNDEPPLLKDRMKRIEDYLASAGLERQKYTVKQGLAGGAGMNAKEAGEIRRATNFSEEQAKADASSQKQAAPANSTSSGSTPK